MLLSEIVCLAPIFLITFRHCLFNNELSFWQFWFLNDLANISFIWNKLCMHSLWYWWPRLSDVIIESGWTNIHQITIQGTKYRVFFFFVTTSIKYFTNIIFQEWDFCLVFTVSLTNHTVNFILEVLLIK